MTHAAPLDATALRAARSGRHGRQPLIGLAAGVLAGMLALLGACSSGQPRAGDKDQAADAALPPSALAVSVNDHKLALVDGVLKVLPQASPDTLSLIDLRGPAPRVVGEIQVPVSGDGPPVSVAVNRGAGIALVTSGKRPVGGDRQTSDNRLSVVDLQARPLRVLKTVAVGMGAAGVSIHPGGRLALVANHDEGTLSVLRIDGKAVDAISKFSLGDARSGPSHVVFSPDGKQALVTRDNDNRISLLAIDGETVRDSQRVMVAGNRPRAIDWCAPGDIAVVANQGLDQGDQDTVSVIDTSANPPRVVDTLGVGQSPEGVACSADGRHVAVSLSAGSHKAKASPFWRAQGKVVVFRVVGKRLQRHGEVDVGGWPQGVLFGPDGSTLLVQLPLSREIALLNVDGSGLRDSGKRLSLPGGPVALRAALR